MRPGTSGLRKRTSVWAANPTYAENFAQSMMLGWPLPEGCTLVVGTDRRAHDDSISRLKS